MTKAEIIAELRRSAEQDELPLNDMKYPAWTAYWYWTSSNEWFGCDEDRQLRTFLLLIAHALEDA